MAHREPVEVVERIEPRFAQWQSRELESVYAFVYVDAMMVKVKQDGKSRNKAVYSVLGIDFAVTPRRFMELTILALHIIVTVAEYAYM